MRIKWKCTGAKFRGCLSIACATVLNAMWNLTLRFQYIVSSELGFRLLAADRWSLRQSWLYIMKGKTHEREFCSWSVTVVATTSAIGVSGRSRVLFLIRIALVWEIRCGISYTQVQQDETSLTLPTWGDSILLSAWVCDYCLLQKTNCSCFHATLHVMALLRIS